MVRSLVRLSKMAAARVEFGLRGMLHGDVHTAVRRELGDPDAEDTQAQQEDAFRQAVQDAQAAGDDREHIHLGARQGQCRPYGPSLLSCS